MTDFSTFLSTVKASAVVDTSIPYTDYVPVDLSTNSRLLATHRPQNASDYETVLLKYLRENKAKVAYGGYCEQRNLYERSNVFKNHGADERNIHIGLDLWIKAGTPVLAALDGRLHSFHDNNNVGDYGPTIILEHHINTWTFYTLYGHLALESIASLQLNQDFKKGEPIAVLGDANVNGDYAPHLHFQIILDLQGFEGDYPGVCSLADVPFYKKNCPDPNLLLKIK